jgi:hypothetical protein
MIREMSIQLPGHAAGGFLFGRAAGFAAPVTPDVTPGKRQRRGSSDVTPSVKDGVETLISRRSVTGHVTNSGRGFAHSSVVTRSVTPAGGIGRMA